MSSSQPDYGKILQQFCVTKPESTNPAVNEDDETPNDIAELVTALVMHQETIPAQDPELVAFPKSLPPSLATALNHQGIHQLYSHQKQAYTALNQGKDVVLTTSTASGKTFATYLAILKTIMEEGGSCLAFYNLKALASDQENSINQLLKTIPQDQRPSFFKMTGDTSQEERRDILASRPDILGVTPEFIHFQLRNTWNLESWQIFFGRLRFILLDEAHIARGMFGANTHMLIQRIKLVVDHYAPARTDGSLPSDHLQFVVLSATCGNAVEHCRHLTGRIRKNGKPVKPIWIEKSGAMAAEKDVFILKPSAGSPTETAKLVFHLMRQGKTGIVFTNSIASVKAIYNLINEESQRRGLDNIGSRVATYYSALRSHHRENILEKVRDGRTKWLISTEALEAGIDLASLDCCIVRGWPGSIQSFRQAIGRCGRQNKGFAFYLPTGKVLDLYYATHPELLLHGPAETITFQVPIILLAKHILCAAVETGIPIRKLKHYFGENAVKVAQELLKQNQINRTKTDLLWAKGYPHRNLSFRGFNQSPISLIDENGEEIEQMSEETAQREVFQNAIYRCQDSNGTMITYQTLDLNLETKEATLKQIPETSAFTKAETHSELNIHTRLSDPLSIPIQIPGSPPSPVTLNSPASPCLDLELSWADLRQVVDGYSLMVRKYSRTCHETGCLQMGEPTGALHCKNCGKATRHTEIVQLVETGIFEKPTKIDMTTPVVELCPNTPTRQWLKGIVQSLKTQIKDEHKEIPKEYRILWDLNGDYIALHTAGHQILKTLPVVIRSDSKDVNFQIYRGTNGISGVFYNAIPESGVVENILTRLPEIAKKAGELARTCSCYTGCGNCLVQHGCPDGNVGLLKPIGLQLLDAISQQSH